MLSEVRFASQPGQVEYAMTQSRLACLKGRSQFPTPRRHADQRPDIQSFGRLLDLPPSGRLHYPPGFGGRRKIIFRPHRDACFSSAFLKKPRRIRRGFDRFRDRLEISAGHSRPCAGNPGWIVVGSSHLSRCLANRDSRDALRLPENDFRWWDGLPWATIDQGLGFASAVRASATRAPSRMLGSE